MTAMVAGLRFAAPDGSDTRLAQAYASGIVANAHQHVLAGTR